MPAITERSNKEPLLKTGILNHGTLHSNDITKTRRFYEEVLGMECIQTSPISLMARKGTEHIYAVIEVPQPNGMNMMNHNGFEVSNEEEVADAHRILKEVKEEYGIKKIMPVVKMHGDTCFYFLDQDDNWWEIVSVREGGYAKDFEEKDEWDLTGRHELEEWGALWTESKKLMHVHDPEVRSAAAQKRAR